VEKWWYNMGPWHSKDWEDGTNTKVLRVPLYTQPDTEPECMVHSLKMCIEYIKNSYPEEHVRQLTRSLSRDEILKYIHVDESGWTKDQTQLDDLSSATGTLKFKLKSKGTVGDIAKELAKTKPVILIYDVYNLLDQGNGGVHAGVAIGLTDSRIILHNPWRGAFLREDLHKFKVAWEEADNDMVLMEINTTFETKLPSEE
jgi:hypothetical protein